MGRKRTKGFDCPPGVRAIGERWYWQPTSARERAERKAAGLPSAVALGEAGSEAARRAWALLTGQVAPEIKPGTVGELLARWEQEAIEKRPRGQLRSENTVRQYRWRLSAIRARFAAARYGKTEFEASRGQAIGTADIQRFLVESGSLGKSYHAILKNAFDHAIRTGLTTYNPCDKATPLEPDARTREALEWEVECLRAIATPVVELLIDFEGISAWRITDMLKLVRAQLQPEGIRVVQKGGKRRIWEWTPESRRIIEAAAALPGATVFPASPVFPNSRGGAYTYAGFNSAWQAVKDETNRQLAAGVVDPDTLQLHQGLSIDDLHFHDLRAKAHDDAQDAGRAGYTLLDDTPRIADKHYARREQRRKPLR